LGATEGRNGVTKIEIRADDIAENAVDSDALADDSPTLFARIICSTERLRNEIWRIILLRHEQFGNVVSSSIADNQILSNHLGSDSVEEQDLRIDAVSTSKIRDDAVTGSKILFGEIQNSHISPAQNLQIEGNRIKDQSIFREDLAVEVQDALGWQTVDLASVTSFNECCHYLAFLQQNPGRNYSSTSIFRRITFVDVPRHHCVGSVIGTICLLSVDSSSDLNL